MIDKDVQIYPLITIITVVYNGEKSLEGTILSIINQSYQRKEYIIIDGNSKDSTLEIVRKYSKQIDHLLSEPDKGIYDAMNKGIELSKGDYIIFMNSGDKFFDCSTLAAIFLSGENSDQIIYGDTIHSNNNFLRLKRSGKISSIKRGLPFCHQSVFVKSTILKERKFDLNYRMSSDYDFFSSLYLKGSYSFKRLDLPVSIYDTNGASSSLLTVKEYSEISSKYFPYTISSQFLKLKVLYFSFTSYLKKILPTKLVDTILIYKRRILSFIERALI